MWSVVVHLQVPCSRSEVFSSSAVSMLEKRKMMKFLTFCSEFETHPEEYKGWHCVTTRGHVTTSGPTPTDFLSLSFSDFLIRKGLTGNLHCYILHSIAQVNEDTPTLEVMMVWCSVVLCTRQ